MSPVPKLCNHVLSWLREAPFLMFMAIWWPGCSLRDSSTCLGMANGMGPWSKCVTSRKRGCHETSAACLAHYGLRLTSELGHSCPRG